MYHYNKLKVHLLSLSGHKIYGPKGIGVLYVKDGFRVRPIQFGGHHESGLRPGTLNVPGIVGIGKAVELLLDKKQKDKENKRIKELRDKLVDEVLKKIPDSQLNGDIRNRVEGNANFCFKNVEGESILLMLDNEGFAVSTGSACASGSLKPSHVLIAMGIPQELAHGSIRVTLGKQNCKEDIKRLVTVLVKVIKRLRNISPLR